MMHSDAPDFSTVRGGLRGAFCALLLALALLASLVGVQPAFATQPGSESSATADSGPSNLIDTQQRPDSSFIYDTLISDLAEADSYYNGQTVQVTGEVIGDNLRANAEGSYRWITLQALDSSYAEVTVYMKAEAASAIDTFGEYGKTGSVVRVRGVFNLACDEHQGLSDIHAESVSVIERGFETPDEFNAANFAPGAALCLAAVVLSLVYYRLRERQR